MTEYEEQKLFVEYLELKGLLFSAIPSSTWTPSWAQKMKNHAMGVRKGVPDILIVLSNRLVFIEMKKKKGGVVSDEQKIWIEALNRIYGVSAFICRGHEEAIEVINNRLLKVY